MEKKLSKKQQEIYNRIKSGEKCLWERMNFVWFMEKDFKKCSKQISILEKKGLVEIKGDGLFRELKLHIIKGA